MGGGGQWRPSGGRERTTPCRTSRGAGAWLKGGAAHSEGWRRLLTGWPGQHSTGGAVQTVLAGSNLNSSIGFKFLQILIESKFTFPYSKNLK
jgi:hypothetical protein